MELPATTRLKRLLIDMAGSCCRTRNTFKGKWQYIFLFSHLKEQLKLFNNFSYRFFISRLVFEIFSLEVMRCQPSWIIFYLINGSFGDVTTGINNIKVFVADQILIGRCFKGFK
jgi:hypothetical protein